MADDPAAGRKIANKCRTCPGIDGFAAIPIAPQIGVEPEDYLSAQLMAFRTRTHEHEIMSEVAAELFGQEIREIADWYAAVTLTIAPPEE